MITSACYHTAGLIIAVFQVLAWFCINLFGIRVYFACFNSVFDLIVLLLSLT